MRKERPSFFCKGKNIQISRFPHIYQKILKNSHLQTSDLIQMRYFTIKYNIRIRLSRKKMFHVKHSPKILVDSNL